jgi:formylmethanofuran dehydrogenase subunit C
MTTGEAARVLVGLGNTNVPIGDLFLVSGSSGDETLRLEGDLEHVQGIGRGMNSGSIEIQGNVGALLGSGMSGGLIDVRGSAGDWVGAEMAGGSIRIRGNVGHFAGAAFPGSRLGMREGSILVEGSAGEDAGLSLRRGLIVVLGDAADGLGRGLIAGTILLGGRPLGHVGAGMKRGSIVLFGALDSPDSAILPSFVRAGRFRSTFLVIYKRQLDEWGFELPLSEAVLSTPFDRYNGDTLNGGQGEILLRSQTR